MPTILSSIPWLRIAPYLALAVLAGLLWLQTGRLDAANDALANERTSRGEVAKLIGAKDNWVSIRTHATEFVTQNHNRGQVLDGISRDTLAAKRRANELDAQLRKQQAENDRRFAAAQRTIADLQSRKATGDVDADRRAISEDSKAPWKNWRPYIGQVGADGIRWVGTDFVHTTVVVNLVRYRSLAALNEKWKEVGGTGKALAFAFSEEGNNVCDIHVVDPEQDYSPIALGHELAHCIYGGFHA